MSPPIPSYQKEARGKWMTRQFPQSFCSSVVPQPLGAAKRRVSPSYDETRQRYLTSLRGYACLCGAHLGDIQMVARIRAGPDQRHRERQASPAQFRSAQRPFAERHVVAGRPDGCIVERDMDRMTCVFASPGPPILRGDHITDTTTEGFYSYQPDAISPNCGSITLEIFSENAPRTPIVRSVSPATVERIWADMEPYRGTKALKVR